MPTTWYIESPTIYSVLGIKFKEVKETWQLRKSVKTKSSKNMHVMKEILVLEYRHPWFVGFVTFIDKTYEQRKDIFARKGAVPKRRVRGNRKSLWKPPTGRPKQFYDKLYLKSLFPASLAQLSMKAEVFELRELPDI